LAALLVLTGRQNPRRWWFGGLRLGIAAATKSLYLLFLPSVAVASIISAVRERRLPLRQWAWILGGAMIPLTFHVDDPKIDAMIAKASQEFDQGKRAKLYQEIQVAILGHYTNIPLYFGSTASGLWSDKVESIPAHPLGFHTMPYETVLMRSF
jgi:ABC-type transport system substrate-binding protein